MLNRCHVSPGVYMRANFSKLPVCSTDSLRTQCCLLNILNVVVLKHETDSGKYPFAGRAKDERCDLRCQHSPSSLHKSFLHALAVAVYFPAGC